MTSSIKAVISTPAPLRFRRWRYQLFPVLTMIAAAAVAGWLWKRNARWTMATGEVSAVRVEVQSKIEAILEELPRPVQVFDTVSKGQIVARLDLRAQEAELARLLAESDRMRSMATTAPTADPFAAERQARIVELQAQLDAREMRSSIDGTVMAIQERPGQRTKLGKPIMVIASNRTDFIIGYILERQGLRPVPGMPVTIRPRDRSGIARSYVEAVGPQVEPIGPRHLRNSLSPEYGFVVRVAIPPEAELKPGEMVDLTFHPNSN